MLRDRRHQYRLAIACAALGLAVVVGSARTNLRPGASEMSNDQPSRRDKAIRAVRRGANDVNAVQLDVSGNVTYVTLQGDFGSTLPTVIQDLGRFQGLAVRYGCLQHGADIDAICSLNALESLVLNDVRWPGVDGPGQGIVCDEFIPRLLELVSLEELQVCSRQLTGRTLGQLGALPRLRFLRVNDLESWAPEAASQVASIPSLVGFSACKVPLSDSSVVTLSQHKIFQELSFIETTITDVALPVLGSLPALTRLTIRGAPITSAGIKGLSDSRSLEWLDLIDCQKLDDDVIDALAKMPALHTVKLGADNKISDVAIQRLTRQKPNILIQHPASEHWHKYGWEGFRAH